MIVVRVGAGNEQPGRSSGEVRLLLDALGCVCAGGPHKPARRGGCDLEPKPPVFLQHSSICNLSLLADRLHSSLAATAQQPASLRTVTSKMVRRSLLLPLLAKLSAAFVLPQQPRLAVRVRADEIEAVEDAADAEPRTAPEVNSGAEAVALRA